jgi:hypothetical protein
MLLASSVFVIRLGQQRDLRREIDQSKLYREREQMMIRMSIFRLWGTMASAAVGGPYRLSANKEATDETERDMGRCARDAVRANSPGSEH